MKKDGNDWETIPKNIGEFMKKEMKSVLFVLPMMNLMETNLKEASISGD